MNRFQKHVKKLGDPYRDRDGEISYRNVYPFAEAVAGYLREECPALLKKNKPLTAASYLLSAVDAFCAEELDDSDGGIRMVFAAFEDTFFDLFCDEPIDRTPSLMEAFRKKTEETELHYITEDLLEEFFASDLLHSCALSQLHAVLNKQETGSLDDHGEMERLLIREFLLLRKLPEYSENLESLKRTFMNYPFLRKAETKALLKEGKEKDAIDALNYYLELFKDDEYAPKEITKELKSLQKKLEKDAPTA